MEGKKGFNSRKAALGGILLAMAVITLYLEAVMPVNKLSLYALSSFFVALMIVESGVKAGWTFYMASCLLAFIIVPDKIALLPYVLFFGLYGIVKFYIEKLRKLILEYLLKFVCFNLSLGAAVLFIREYIANIVKIDFPWWALVIALEIVFFIYDYVYTLFIQYYNQKLAGILKLR